MPSFWSISVAAVSDVVVFAGHELVGAFEDCDLGSEAAEDLAELHADVASADDHEVLGDGVEIEQPGVVEPVDLVEAGDGHLKRAGAGVDDDCVARDDVVADLDFVLADEVCVVGVEVDAVHGAEPLSIPLLSRMAFIRSRTVSKLMEYSRFRLRSRVHGGPCGQPSAGNECLGRGAAVVDT